MIQRKRARTCRFCWCNIRKNLVCQLGHKVRYVTTSEFAVPTEMCEKPMSGKQFRLAFDEYMNGGW
jgi:hypothetical protein